MNKEILKQVLVEKGICWGIKIEPDIIAVSESGTKLHLIRSNL